MSSRIFFWSVTSAPAGFSFGGMARAYCEYENKVSIYRGPILLTYDRRFNTVDPDHIPALDAKGLGGDEAQIEGAFMTMKEFIRRHLEPR